MYRLIKFIYVHIVQIYIVYCHVVCLTTTILYETFFFLSANGLRKLRVCKITYLKLITTCYFKKLAVSFCLNKSSKPITSYKTILNHKQILYLVRGKISIL